jgi:hypothetical protein
MTVALGGAFETVSELMGRPGRWRGFPREQIIVVGSVLSR